MLLAMFAALQSGVMWRMNLTERHCGLYSGKVTNVATVHAVYAYIVVLVKQNFNGYSKKLDHCS